MTLSVYPLPDTTLRSLRALDAMPEGQSVVTPCGLRYEVRRRLGRSWLAPRDHPEPEAVSVSTPGWRLAVGSAGYSEAHPRGPGPCADVESFGGPPSADGFYDPDWYDFLQRDR